jgi:hypothetical protein
LIVEGAKPPQLDVRNGAVVEVASLGQLISAQEFAVVEALDVRESGAFRTRLRELAEQPQPSKTVPSKVASAFSLLDQHQIVLPISSGPAYTMPLRSFPSLQHRQFAVALYSRGLGMGYVMKIFLAEQVGNAHCESA